ncbi:ATP-binding protein [Niveibacterium umoris]|uniref:histidine kinase n=1 Tax=Niveibacterium umoris TaxID=1193620 RepID=A0A840BM78_9RHOO|nr:ATP-binding protein [Niveibacterium umoris]MBB4013604.1 signal transduction histidine kinase [Niveibacterium umoris]
MQLRLIPKSLAVRIFFLMAGGIVAATFLSRWVIEKLYTDELERLGQTSAIERISDVVRVLDTLPRADRAVAAAGISFERLSVSFPSTVGGAGEFDPMLRDKLARGIRRPPGKVRFEALAPQPCTPAAVPDCDDLAKRFAAELALADGQPVRVEYTTRWVKLGDADWVPWVIGIVMLVVLAWLSVRIATRPLRAMAEHAAGLGRDLQRAPLDEDGPTEVRDAAHAFNAMQAQIRRQIDERTQMLAAIAHDLKTPLTRMRLRLELIDDDALRGKLGEDVSAMQTLINEGLDFARSLDAQEQAQRIDLSAMLDTLCEDARDSGQAVQFSGDAGIVVPARANALRRVFLNLIDNAVKYGGSAAVSVSREGAQIAVRVRDSGPGIPPEHLEDVLKPYYRLEGSRSRETGGTGLGLAIAANLVAAQSGQLRLRNHPLGGLEAEVRIAA